MAEFNPLNDSRQAPSATLKHTKVGNVKILWFTKTWWMGVFVGVWTMIVIKILIDLFI